MNKMNLRLLMESLAASRDHLKSLKIRLRSAQAPVGWSQKAIKESQEQIAKLEMAIDREKRPHDSA